MEAMIIESTDPTPLGGNRSVAVFMDSDGRECDVDDATRVEITEYSDDLVLGRTYMDTEIEPQAVPLSPSDGVVSVADQDWIKTGEWDVRNSDWEPVTTLVELLDAFVWSGLSLAEQRQEVAHFVTLPVWSSAPAKLKAEVSDWLVNTRQE